MDPNDTIDTFSTQSVMPDADQIKKALASLDLTDVAFKLSQMTLKIISGKEIDEKTYQVPLKLPAELGEVFELLAKKTGVPVKYMLAELAKEGFNASLANKISNTRQPPPQQDVEKDIKDIEDEFSKMASAVGIDMGGLRSKMSQFTEAVDKLQQIQKVVENVDTSETPKDSSKSPVPLRPLSCPDSGKK